MYHERITNRTEAGQLLADKLKQYQNTTAIVLAIPRGGLVIGYEIAKKLHLPLDVLISKKIEHPNNPEYAIGAVSEDTVLIDYHPEVSREYIRSTVKKLQKTILEKTQLYRNNRKPIAVESKNVIIVDDGIATGNTLLACLEVVRKKNPAKIIIAVPVLPMNSVTVFKEKADELVYLIASNDFGSIGSFYDHFEQVKDEEAIEMLQNIPFTK